MDQQIRFCRSADGTRIAYATIGSGPALVQVPPWVTHLELLWEVPEYRTYNEALAADFTVVRIDKRGNGLSQRGVTDYSLEARLADLEAVVDDLRLETFFLDGYSEGGPTSIAYAVKHPDRVRRMILNGTWAQGNLFGTEELRNAVIAMIRAEWGLGASTLAELFLGADAPSSIREAFAWMQKEGATPEDAAQSMLSNFGLDIRHLLPQVTMPVLVTHARGDRVVPIELGREIAGGIPGARFISRDGGHVPVNDAQMETLRAATWEFLAEDAPNGTQKQRPSSVSPSVAAASVLHTIMFTDMESSTAITQRVGDAAAQDLVRAHNSAVRDALRQHGGNEIKHTGDGIMASFTSASAAIECAQRIQRTLAAAGQVRVRIGINAGEPVAEEHDLFGTAVQLAKRVCDAGDPGDVLVSNVVRELSAGKGYSFADRGYTALKGFEEPVRLFEVRWREDEP